MKMLNVQPSNFWTMTMIELNHLFSIADEKNNEKMTLDDLHRLKIDVNKKKQKKEV